MTDMIPSIHILHLSLRFFAKVELDQRTIFGNSTSAIDFTSLIYGFLYI